MHRIALGVTFAALAVYGQTFEVASVRVSAIGKAGGEGSRRESIQPSPDGVNMRNVSFRSAVRWAYHVMDYQVQGPDWLNSERYDIVAKAAAQVPEEQIRQMLQALLADRFKLEVHHTTKEMAAWVLLVAKGGPKFKESTTDGEMNVAPNQQRMSVVVQRAPISQLIDGLTNILRAPVLDETGLKGKYDVTIDAAKYLPEMEAARESGRGGAPIDPIGIIQLGLQGELGLKLESRKMALDLVVVDKAEKVPTEN